MKVISTRTKILYSDGLVQDRSISIANALDKPPSCTKPSKKWSKNALYCENLMPQTKRCVPMTMPFNALPCSGDHCNVEYEYSIIKVHNKKHPSLENSIYFSKTHSSLFFDILPTKWIRRLCWIIHLPGWNVICQLRTENSVCCSSRLW